MKLLPLALPLALLAACAMPPKNPAMPEQLPAPVPASAEHQWLMQLVGTWDVTGEADMGPDVEPMRTRFVEKVTPLGEYWVISALDADFDGVKFQGRHTVGWDPAANSFVGTWVDSLNTTLWTYRGWLDAERTTLTLEAEGPSMTDPNAKALYRDVVEILSPGKKHQTSWIQGPEGEWIQFMSASGTRLP